MCLQKRINADIIRTAGADHVAPYLGLYNDRTGRVPQQPDVNAEHVNAEHVNAAHVDAEHVNAEHVNAAHVDAEHVNAAHVDAPGHEWHVDALLMPLYDCALSDVGISELLTEGATFARDCEFGTFLRVAAMAYRSLHAIHAAGYLHHDVKCANFVCSWPLEDEAPSRVVAIDVSAWCPGLSDQSVMYSAPSASRREPKLTPGEEVESLAYSLCGLVARLPWLPLCTGGPYTPAGKAAIKAAKKAFCETVQSQGLAAALEFDPSYFAAADWARFDAAVRVALRICRSSHTRDTAAIIRLLEGE